MKRLFGIAMLICFFSVSSVAEKKQSLPDWQDPQVFQKNRIPMSSYFETDGLRLSLNGTWSFKWYETIDERSRDFSLRDMTMLVGMR